LSGINQPILIVLDSFSDTAVKKKLWHVKDSVGKYGTATKTKRSQVRDPAWAIFDQS